MAIDPKKRQKQLARQKAKRKEKARESRRGQAAKSASPWTSLEFELAMRLPIYECLASDDPNSQGMRQVVVSRRTRGGMVAGGVFMIDTFCLGVKNTYAFYQPLETYERMVAQIQENQPLYMVEPAYAKKLIEDAIAYARDLGFEPQEDYRMSRKTLHDVDSASCTETFTFGQNGKPFYIAGPYESPIRSRAILATLERRCGPGGYEYLVAIGGGLSTMGDGEDDDEDDDDDDDLS